MKDIIITSKRQKKELYILAACFFISFIINIAAVIIYKTTWKEVFTQIGYVVAITIVIYTISSILRLLIKMLSRLLKNSK